MRYVLKKIRKINGRDITTGKNRCILSDLKSCVITGNADVVWADGQDGAHLVGFDVNKVAGITAENGTIDIGYLETQTGGTFSKVKDGTGILFAETLTTTDGTKITTSHKASGITGNEIGFVYPIDATGDPDRLNAYEQGATASPTTFAYDPNTKEISLPTGVFEINSEIYIEYFPTFKEYEELDNDSDKFSEILAVYVDGWFTDICTKKDVPLQLVLPTGKVSGEINLQMGDQAAVQNLKIDAMTTCGEKALWKLYKYNMTDVSAI